MAVPIGLARRTLGTWSLAFFSVGASAPMTVLAGGIPSAYMAGPVGVAAGFVLLTFALGLFSVGYVAAARHGAHAGPLYALVARGLGPVRGIAAAAVALLSYNAINICLYGLLGATLAELLGGAWWLWALAAWLLVATLGVLHVKVNAGLLAWLLVVEIAVVVLFDLAALTHPTAGHLDVAALSPSHLFVSGVGGLLALCVACFVGYETAVGFAEEARSHPAVVWASLGALAVVGLLYTVSAWAYAAAAGPDVAGVARSSGASLVFEVLGARYGLAVRALAWLLLVTSIFAAILSFHHTAARYAFALGREELLPARFGQVALGRRGGVPTAGSLLQSAIAIVVVTVHAVAGADPVAVLFTQLAALAAIGVMALMAVGCIAVLRFYRHGGGGSESPLTRVVAPGAGAVAVGALLLVMVANLDSLLGGASAATWVLPAAVAVVAVAGLGWGVVVRHRRPRLLALVGRGEPEPLAELEHALAAVEV